MSLVIAFRLLQRSLFRVGGGGGGIEGLWGGGYLVSGGGGAAHVTVQLNGNHWLRLNPLLLDEADIFMYSSQLVLSVHPPNADTHPSSAVLRAYLIRIFLSCADARPRALLFPAMSFLVSTP